MMEVEYIVYSVKNELVCVSGVAIYIHGPWFKGESEILLNNTAKQHIFESVKIGMTLWGGHSDRLTTPSPKQQ